MKKLLLSFLFIATAYITLAQNLSITVNYLETRLKDVQEKSIIIFSNGTEKPLDYSPFFWYDTIKNQARYVLWLKNKNDASRETTKYEFIFKPELIKEIKISEQTSENSVVGLIDVFFENKAIVQITNKLTYPTISIQPEFNESTEYVDRIFIAYVKGDPSAFERIKKALLNLKKLTSGKDPFAN